ncbi:aquaporin AQPAn.G isoform X3 [Leptinotarsa decemlineata]|uniref:aquaporin AQPAn.G isoform X3 n=1 Tax=Leptinotarsa decemlineata TaxID=7539 RepID=UPI003D304F90
MYLHLAELTSLNMFSPVLEKIKFDDHLSNIERLILCLAELGGTAILVFLGCMGCARGMVDTDISGGQISLTFGLAIMIGIQIFGHISGSHLNPAVTVAAFTLGHIPLIQVPIFFVGQILGSLAGFGLLKAVTPSYLLKFPNSTIGLCSASPNGNLSSFQGPYSGAHMNPARTFGPALFNGNWDFHLLYWVGPICGGFVAAMVYRLIFSREASHDASLEEQRSSGKT